MTVCLMVAYFFEVCLMNDFKGVDYWGPLEVPNIPHATIGLWAFYLQSNDYDELMTDDY